MAGLLGMCLVRKQDLTPKVSSISAQGREQRERTLGYVSSTLLTPTGSHNRAWHLCYPFRVSEFLHATQGARRHAATLG